MLVRKEIDISKGPSKKQIEMLERAATFAPTYDEDNPELTVEELSQFRRISDSRRAERRKQTVTLRLSPQTLAKAKSLGKGYTSVLSRLLEMDLNDSERIRQCL